ncbi:hypothetical protein BZL30_5170 [Mycobacterium kansasii]|uniref:Uncharacterized protein n=1 Tax=Mycobacterium kansasii TaxID=1768 RepID=A0A1V3X4E8_MYCKA|nr:hypothetical protein BZL30_5170 [Mycobacterium kansasii]
MLLAGTCPAFPIDRVGWLGNEFYPRSRATKHMSSCAPPDSTADTGPG